MSGVRQSIISSKNAAAMAMILAVAAPISARADTPMTAGNLMKEMPVRERTAYITGIVDGLAFARFRKDTLAKGEKDEAGMICVHNWFHKDSLATLLRIEATFQKYADELPSLLLALMVKKECGE